MEKENRVSTVVIGEKLRLAREKKALTIEQAQKQTHIHSTVLTALEEGRCDDILTPNYVKSFLKEYSNYLELDSKETVSEYEMLHPELRTKDSINLSRPDTGGGLDLPDIVRLVRNIIIAVLALALLVFLGIKTTAFFKNSKFAKKAVQQKYQLSPNQAKQPVKKNPPKAPAAVKRGPFTLTLKVKHPVMVQLRKDGVLLFKRVLPKGTIESFAANNNINMFVARGESVELTLNGKPLGSPGRGTIQNLEVTSSGIKIK